MFLLFFLIWLTLSGEVTAGNCLLGAAVSLALYAFCVRQLGYAPRYDLLGAKKLRKVLSYMGYLVVEILKASFGVMKLIYTRDHRMEPLLVRFDTGLQSPAARAVLGNSITLTAGTITVEDQDGHLCVHTLDRPLAEGIENSEFQRLLLELERTDD
ncbi:Na+/H+ antiporter subunit E [Dysosmobacter sp.]|uniref:Na+/H+ antiporter subunit E n=1 Tax=Dysosmobacter sp. TaxID=2591382 RepID=UPI002A8B91AC|nr:Na+/H+ antiporter subunit E [Dysosmobacter sp.]MDY3282153.1 Na+/H+ antiporter subunit E [Dysosmobacter sp.]